jgi:5-methylcytosine-specific restriction endonuclease McrA
MPAVERVTIEQIVDAYRSKGSIWKAAKSLGVCGQSVWERLKAIDYPMARRVWTADELAELTVLATNCTISGIAERLGRPYYTVAIKLSRLGLANRYGNRHKKQIRRGSGFTQVTVPAIVKKLRVFDGSLRKFCKMHSYEMEMLVHSIQRYDPEFWAEYAASRSDLAIATCPYCHNEYHPMTAKQQWCSRKCGADAKRDIDYFGGNRRNTIGLAEGICQLCLQQKDRGLSAHHVLGKQHDPDNQCLVALCQGCHQLVGTLAGRRFVDSNEGWENLITLVMGRRMADKSKEYAGAYACVELEYMTAEDVFEYEDHSGNSNGLPERAEITVTRLQ